MSKFTIPWVATTFTITPMIGGFIGGIFVRKNIKGWYEVIELCYIFNNHCYFGFSILQSPGRLV